MEDQMFNNTAARPEPGSERVYDTSFRCHYEVRSAAAHYHQALPLKDIPRWIEAYKYTHPGCLSIIVKVPLARKEVQHEAVAEKTAQPDGLC